MSDLTWLNWLADWCRANGLATAHAMDRLREVETYRLAYSQRLGGATDRVVGRLLRLAAIEAGLLEGE